ncbi:MAG TPA: hypothetical protein VII38_04725 [Polyangia bacterium]
MRAAPLALVAGFVVAAAGPAVAEAPVPIAVAPFSTRCFDAAELADRVRARMPEATVEVGAPPPGAHQLVRVAVAGDSLVVRVTATSARHRVVGSERRLLPAAGECGALLELSAQIVIRAATPIRARVELRPPAHHGPSSQPNGERSSRHEPVARAPERRNEPQPQSAPPIAAPSSSQPTPENSIPSRPSNPRATNPTSTNPASTNASANDANPANANASPNANARMNAGPAPAVKTHPAPTEVPAASAPAARRSMVTTRRALPARRRRVEIDAAAMWAFPLDGPPSNPAGELAVGYAWSRLGVTVRAGVEGQSTFGAQSSAGPVTVSTRRVPISAELHFDLPVRGGAVRFGAGPELALWLAHSGGVPRQASRVLAEPGATVRASYRLELGRVVLGFGVDLDVSFLGDDLAIGGVGTVGRTPIVQLAPYLSLGTQIF